MKRYHDGMMRITEAEANQAFREGQADAIRREVRRDAALWSLLPALVEYAVERGVAREALERGTRLRHAPDDEGEDRVLFVLDWQSGSEYEIAVDCRSGELVSHRGAADSAAVVDVTHSRDTWLDPRQAVDQVLERIYQELRRQ